jgi:hypothetical protein
MKSTCPHHQTALQLQDREPGPRDPLHRVIDDGSAQRSLRPNRSVYLGIFNREAKSRHISKTIHMTRLYLVASACLAIEAHFLPGEHLTALQCYIPSPASLTLTVSDGFFAA